MNILVTGGSGFLGQRLIARLTKEGHQVAVLGRKKPARLPSGVAYINADITKTVDLKKAKEQTQPGTIIHLAALVPKSVDEDTPVEMVEINVGGTANLLDAFAGGLKNFVYASTAEVYGLPVTNNPIDEETLPNPLSYYGATKLAGEHVCRIYGLRNNLPVSILRFSVMYGPGDRISRALPNFINSALKGQNLEVYGGEELRDYIYIDDCAQALALAAERPTSGVFNIGTGKGISVREAAQKIIEAVDTSLSLDIKPREKKSSDIVLDISKAKTELGFIPKNIFPAKLEEQIQWHKNNP